MAQAMQSIEPQCGHAEAALTLLTVTSDLAALLTDESDILAAGKADGITALAGRKAELFAADQEAMQVIKALAQPRLVLDDALRKSLRTTAQGFKAALERNQTLLSQRLEGSQKLMKTIGNEVQRQQNPVQTYQSPLSANSNQAPTSLALNQTI